MTQRQRIYLAHRLAHLEIHGERRVHSLDRACPDCRAIFIAHLRKLEQADPATLEAAATEIDRRRRFQCEEYRQRMERQAKLNERMPPVPKARIEISWRSCLS